MLVSIMMALIWCQECAGMILEFVTFAHCHDQFVCCGERQGSYTGGRRASLLIDTRINTDAMEERRIPMDVRPSMQHRGSIASIILPHRYYL